ncbi:hypothetical protein OROGR_025796 [Orobanche gracilis]
MEVIRRPRLERSSLVVLFFAVLTVGAFICTRYLDSSASLINRNTQQKSLLTTKPLRNHHSEATHIDQNVPKTINIPLNSQNKWAEINIKPWESLSKDLKEGNTRTKWTDREAHAYWKGNPTVATTRMDLLKCNVSDKQDWKARVYSQDWLQEQKQGYKQSDLASQCVHRYKIYIEGSAWSVSEKYILACDSVTLLVKPHYYDFFTRSLMPLKHYWPIKDDDKCRSIKYAVEWGDSHQQEAQAIGKAASSFILNDMKMDYVYDYMFHLLSEYAKLLTYKPTIPKEAVELCSESMACHAQGFEKQFMTESLVKGPAISEACTMPPPYDPASLHSVIQGKVDAIKQVENWEREYWQS